MRAPPSEDMPRRASQSFGAAMADAVPTGKNYRRKTTFMSDLTREYIGEVFGSNSTTAVVQQFSVNPGQAQTFPLLSSIAKLYEKYRFKKLRFLYRPEVSQYSTGGQTGKVVFGFDYDAADAPPTTKVQIEDTDIHCDAMGYQAMALTVPTADADNVSRFRYVRPGALPGGTDIKTYDVGNINVLTYNNGVTTSLGELWVEYQCEFDVRINENTVAPPLNNQVTVFSTVSGGEPLTTTTVAQNLALSNTYGGPSIGALFNGCRAVNSTGNIVLPAGNYLVDAAGYVDFTGSASSFSATLVKNNADYNSVNNNPAAEAALVAAGSFLFNVQPWSFTGYITSNGTDVYNLSCGATFASGAATVVGTSLRFTAI